MSNLIQIKRSLTSAIPGSLANGELAYTSAGDIFYIGSPNGSIVAIGGARTPGILTANQALIANATSYINEIKTANATLDKIYANGAHGTAGQLLTSDASGNVYWNTPLPSVVGANTQIQFNDEGALGANASFTFDKNTQTLYVQNAVSTAYLTATNGSRNLTTNYNSVSGAVGVATDLTVGASGTGGNTAIRGNVSLGVTGNNQLTSISNTFLEVRGGWESNDGLLSLFGGNYSTSNYAKIALQGNNKSATVEADTTTLKTQTGSIFIATANATGFYVEGTVNASVLSVGTSFLANSSRVVIGSGVGVQANGSIGTSGDVLVSDGTTAYWDTRISSVSTGDGLSGGFITDTGTIAVLANNGIIANGSGVFVNPGTGVTVNATGVHIGQAVGTSDNVQFNDINITGNTTLGNSNSDIVTFNSLVNSDITPNTDITFNLGSAANRWANVYVADVRANTGHFSGNVQISGNLYVLGTTFTVSANNLIVDDTLIQLGANNTGSDLLDIGFYGNYNNDGGSHEHAGLFRDATDDTFKLFKGLQDAPTSTVNTAGVGYTLATLQAYLSSGGLTTSSSSVSLTANSTVSVSITANTLSLSTALAGTSGGTGRLTSTNQALLVGNTSNGYDELVLGTDGYVLQSNGSAIVYATLDGGSF